MSTPILDVDGLTRIHGRGCARCIALTGDAAGTNICSACGAVVAVADVSFRLQRGECLGVMGESGSGKSTLVKVLYGDDRPSAGRAVYHDKNQDFPIFSPDAARALAAQSSLRHGLSASASGPEPAPDRGREHR